jgi:3alpha(or 20beta)-hydroxysteroid dehydrogenase
MGDEGMAGLAGKVAIVTGAARGAGAAIARRFVGEGARVVLGDVRHEQGRALAKELGAGARYCEHDVASRAQWDAAVAETIAAFGRVDALVNNAAVLHLRTLEHTSEELLQRVLAVNLAGAYLGIQAVIGALKAQGGGSIVNVSSIDGMLGMNGVTAYAASNWGLRGLTKSAAMELGSCRPQPRGPRRGARRAAGTRRRARAPRPARRGTPRARAPGSACASPCRARDPR